jgi:hypothetical protein
MASTTGATMPMMIALPIAVKSSLLFSLFSISTSSRSRSSLLSDSPKTGKSTCSLSSALSPVSAASHS